jgi:hypothetical protein
MGHADRGCAMPAREAGRRRHSLCRSVRLEHDLDVNVVAALLPTLLELDAVALNDGATGASGRDAHQQFAARVGA